MLFKNKDFKKAIIKIALDANYYGKRLRDKKLEVIEGKIFNLVEKFGQDTPEVGDIVDWLEENKPAQVATKKAKQQSNKQAHETVKGEFLGETEQLEDMRECHAFIITSVQNNTKINEPFFKALQLYTEALNAQLLVSGFTYNKTGYQLDRDNNVYFDKRVQPYMVNKPTRLFDNLVFAAELDIIPTATRPTNGHVGYHGDNSLIIGHSKVELQSLATPQGDDPKFIYSTGCCSLKNYRQQRAGQRAESQHSISALIVERNNKCSTGWQVRQLHWVNDSFIDLEKEIFQNHIEQALPAHALSFGDVHAEKVDYIALQDAINLGRDLQVKNIFLHDLLDFSSRNSHARENHFFIAGMGDQSVKDDLKIAAEVLIKIEESGADHIQIVRSNHDEQLDRWLECNKYNFMQDAINARLYLDLQSKCYSYIEQGKKKPDLFQIALDVCGIKYPDNVQFLTRKSVVKIDNVMLTDHGDCGTNGSRGTPTQMSKIYAKSTTGHTHTAGIIAGNYCSGVVGSLFMGYNERGASSWSHSSTIQYSNGARAIITY